MHDTTITRLILHTTHKEKFFTYGEIPMAENHAVDRPTLEKSMSPLAIWALAFGAIIGWGAFVMPGLRFLPGSGPLGSVIGFVAGGIMLIFVALAYGRLVGAFPIAGGVFAFAYAAFGPTLSFVCGWALVLGYLSIIALNATAIVLLTRFLLPGIFEFGHLYTIVDWHIYAGELALLEAVLVLFWYLNYRGADVVGKIQVALAIILAAGVILIMAGAALHPTSSIANLQPYFATGKTPLACIIAVTAIAPWLFVGFDTIPQAAEEFNFKPSMSTILMILSIVCGIITYAAITIAVAVVVPWEPLIRDFTIFWHTGHVVNLTLGAPGSIILGLAVLSAILTGINGFYIACSRLLFSMGRSRILPTWFAEIHPTHKTPTNALNFILVLVIVAPFFGREVLSWVVDMSSIGTIIGYFFASLASYKLASSCVHLQNGTTKPLAILGCISSLICLGLLILPVSPASISIHSWVVLGIWTILGFVVYYMRLAAVKSIPERERAFLILGDNELFHIFLRRMGIHDSIL